MPSIPYRDFAFEYPPLAFIPLWLPRLWPGSGEMAGYALAFALTNLVWFACGGWLIGLIARRSRLPARYCTICYCVLSVAISPLLVWRYDLFPMVLGLGAMVCLVWPVWAGIFLGLAVAAKLYPVVFAPALGLYYLTIDLTRETAIDETQQRTNTWHKLLRPFAPGHRRCLQFSSGFWGALLLSFLPFGLAAPESFLSFLDYHQARGFQIESSWAGVISLLHRFGLVTASSEMNYGAQHIVSPLADWLRPVQQIASLLVMLGLAIAIGVHFWRSSVASTETVQHLSLEQLLERDLHLALAALLLGFILTSKVFSPQYLIWLMGVLPLAFPLLRGACIPPIGRWGFRLTIVAYLLTAGVSFVTRKLRLFYLPSVLMLNLKNAILLGLFVALVWAMARARLGDREWSSPTL